MLWMVERSSHVNISGVQLKVKQRPGRSAINAT